MRIPEPKTATRGLRAIFDELVELSAAAREVRLAALNLPYEEAQRLRAMLIFDDLASGPPEARERELALMDLPAAMKTRLSEMLRTDAEVPQLLAAATTATLDCDDAADSLADSMAGTSIGTFSLVKVIGQGGSSVVFRAERKAGDGTQVVALKLLRTGLYSAQSQNRFRREQALLARLTHPNIATLIEGGVSSAGIPYIAMELVDGLPITLAANASQLNLAQRLSLFVTLCRAIEAAHTALVIHRDLKPSNVLVAADGTLKVLDFGIAKLIDGDDGATRTRSVALTPEYAAPEQFVPGALTTATDVYALGVLLAELLTGKRLRGNTRVSHAVAAADVENNPTGMPARRALARVLRGDLDDILATALADVPGMRYRSAGAFADDVELYLQGRPVRAHPPSRWYRARKFVARNRLLVAISTVMICVIVALLLDAVVQANVAREQAKQASAQAERAQAARDLLVSAFDAAGADLPKDKRPSAQDIVDQATTKLLEKTQPPDPLRVDLLLTLAHVSKSVGSYDHALMLLDRIVAIDEEPRVDDPLWWQAIVLRASVLAEKGQPAAAIAILDPLRAQLALREDAVGVEGMLTLGKALLHEAEVDAGLDILHRAVVVAQTRHLVDLLLRACLDEATQSLITQQSADSPDRADAALAIGSRISTCSR